MARVRKLLVGAVVFAGILLLAIALFWLASPKPQKFVSQKGSVTLEGHNFSTNAVEYRSQKSVLDHRILAKITKPFRKYLPTFEQKRLVSRPTFPGEPMLSAAFLINFPRPEDSFAGRVAVNDENGNEFDPVGQHAGTIGDVPAFYLGEIPVFPRRSRTLNLKLKQNAGTVAEFQIPNPAHRDYPQWTATPLPVTSSHEDLVVKLTEFAVERPKEYGERFPATRCGFQIVQRGSPTTNWIPQKAEIFDATGNHWSPFWYRERAHFADSIFRLAFFGALWPGEEAWKLRVSFQKNAGFSDDELIRFELPVPIGGEILRPKLVHEEGDARLEVAGLFGPEVTRDRADDVFPNINPRFGMVAIALKARAIAN